MLPLTEYGHALIERRARGAQAGVTGSSRGHSAHRVEYESRVHALRRLTGLLDFVVYDPRRACLTAAESLDLAIHAPKALVNHKQPRDDVTGGYPRLTPDRLRKPAQQVEDKLFRMANAKPGADVVQFRKWREENV